MVVVFFAADNRRRRLASGVTRNPGSTTPETATALGQGSGGKRCFPAILCACDKALQEPGIMLAVQVTATKSTPASQFLHTCRKHQFSKNTMALNNTIVFSQLSSSYISRRRRRGLPVAGGGCELGYDLGLQFFFDFSQLGGYNAANFSFDGDAYYHPQTQVIELTKNDRSQGLPGIIYAQPVLVWDEDDTDELASFTTTFSIQILRDDNHTTGDGMAFFLGHYPSSIPSNGAVGGNLGLLGTDAVGDNRVVAVEFNTFKNSNYNDTSDNHTWGSTSTPSSPRLTPTAQIRVSLLTYKLATRATTSTPVPTLGYSSQARWRSIGFSGATGKAVELHRVLAWRFNSTLDRAPASSPVPAQSPPPNPGGSSMSKVPWMIIGSGIGVVVAAALGVLLACLWKPGQQRSRQTTHYRELAEATDKFAAHSKLGEGGYAVVYNAQLKNPSRLVAIKNFKLLRQSACRRKAFEDEIKVIIRQRHLVRWCIDEEKDIMSLVYELVSEGSLHEHLHKARSWLPWSRTYQIILNLGCALRYLHGECTDCVLHGDISASNILLDSNYTSRFARLMDHSMELKTTCNLAGTPGYIDPDFLKTGRRSRESDLRHCSTRDSHWPEPCHCCRSGCAAVSPLLKWVWGIQHCSAVLEAADPRLRYESTRNQQEQMERVLQVGLWCAHTDPTQRPSIKQAMMALESWDVVNGDPSVTADRVHGWVINPCG
ncbi:LOW QUALITY PROTEIN: hypothetical protein U9M48_014100 [Paspalum notatum var. saurae]|uniref:Protein kinase domain-containing protein n=1 Tax=Paspalum notatum var. saurae TaxID=547442 RepID=A0AAQ3T0V4_PASNO